MDKINICGIPHTIIICDDAFTSNNAHLGEIDYKSATIKISSGMTKEMENQTVMHELLHGLLTHLGYCDLSNDEQFVTALSMAMCGSLKIVRM